MQALLPLLHTWLLAKLLELDFVATTCKCVQQLDAEGLHLIKR